MKPILTIPASDITSINSGYFILKKDISKTSHYEVEVLNKESWISRRKNGSASELFQLKKIITLANQSSFVGTDQQLQALQKKLAEGAKKHNARKIRVLRFLLLPWLIAVIFKIDTFATYKISNTLQKKTPTAPKPDSRKKISSEEQLEQASTKLEDFIKTLAVEDAVSLYHKIKSKLRSSPTHSLDAVIQALFSCETKRTTSNEVCVSLLKDLSMQPTDQALSPIVNVLGVDIWKEIITQTQLQITSNPSNEQKINLLVKLLELLAKPETKTELLTFCEAAKLLTNADFQQILKVFPAYAQSMSLEQLLDHTENCKNSEDRKQLLSLLNPNQKVPLALKWIEKAPELSAELFDVLPEVARDLSVPQLKDLAHQLQASTPNADKTFIPQEWELMKQFVTDDRKTRLEKFGVIFAPYLEHSILPKFEALYESVNDKQRFANLLLDVQLFNFYSDKKQFSKNYLTPLPQNFYTNNHAYFVNGLVLMVEKLKVENKNFDFSILFKDIYSKVDYLPNLIVFDTIKNCLNNPDLDLRKAAFLGYCLSENDSHSLQISPKALACLIQDKQTLRALLEIIPQTINERIREKILLEFFIPDPTQEVSEYDTEEEKKQKMQPLSLLSVEDIAEVLREQTAENLACLKKLGIAVN